MMSIVGYVICKYFHPVCTVPFFCIFSRPKVLNFVEDQFITVFNFIDYNFGVIFKNSLPNSRSQIFPPMFFPKSCIVLYFTFRTII